MKKVLSLLIVMGVLIAAYGLYTSSLIASKAARMAHAVPTENHQAELCGKSGCYFVSVEDKIEYERGSLIVAIGVFTFVVSLFVKRIYDKKIAQPRDQ